ncbi:hypothetical protein [Povalibacter sp.]|uniref:hypothetical protein n=1 Tax=Povalibacter sp. TaxID=1962978 RepID=UPI002F41BBC9
MDPLTTLYDRLRERAGAAGNWPEEPPLLQDWLRFWNDEDTDLGNLRNFEHWISRARCERGIAR